MRFLADENVPGHIVEALRSAGHDVGWVRLDAPGSRDRDVLDRSLRECRILLTFDKDFGELAARQALPPDAGIILLRVQPRRPGSEGSNPASIIAARDDWGGHFSVIEAGRVRMRTLPFRS
jgi:hypothetical protein